MFFSSRIVVFYFFVLINSSDGLDKFEKCIHSSIARDQKLIPNKLNRHKRFVLFPEFKSWMNDWRYLNHPKNVIYWISNYYPTQINSKHVHSYISHIINSINQVIDHKISSVKEGKSLDEANFFYNFFNYEICPSNDPLATTKGVQSGEPMLIYPRHIIKENRYRAHGGIVLDHGDNSTTSHMKFNIHHTFLFYHDFQYDPVEYYCDSDENHCTIDLYAVMLHETLHGFGIEHTEPNLPNKNMLAVMHLYASRIMCHDDIRAIRMVYGLPVKRQNAKYDDTCRRDFPLNRLQWIMYQIHQWLIFYGFLIVPCISFVLFLLTIIYIILRKYCLNRNNDGETPSLLSGDDSPQQYHKQHKSAMNTFLWHDDYLNG